MSPLEHLPHTIDDYFSRVHEAPVTVNVTPNTVRRHLTERYDFTHPIAIEHLVDDVNKMLYEWTEYGSHPMHFGLFRPAIDKTAILADALVALYDPNLATWEFSPAANEIERHVLTTIASRFGWKLEPYGIAHFTSGGQEANHTAVAVALTAKFPEIARQGLRGLSKSPVFYVSEEGHHSFDKVARSTWLGRDALRFVPVKDDLKMNLDALESLVRQDRERGLALFLVVGTAGTTSAGIVDSLAALADFAKAQGLWFHVDGAWGGAAAISRKLSPVLDGIESANSITCDAHKWFSVPVGTGMFFCQHRRAVEKTFGTDAAYVPDRHDDRTYSFITSMQWPRRFTGLKLFMMLAEHGIEGLAARIERQTELGDYLRARLRSRGFVLLNETPFPVICFTHPQIERDGTPMSDVVERLRQEQTTWISKTKLRGRVPALRACIANFRTSEADIKALVDALCRAVCA